jgi:hypothetical protein
MNYLYNNRLDACGAVRAGAFMLTGPQEEEEERDALFILSLLN